MVTLLSRRAARRSRAGSAHLAERARAWLYEAARTVVGPAEEAAQRQDVIRRALVAPAVVAIVPVEQLHLPGWEAVVAACSAALLYNVPLAHLVYVRRQFFLARVLAFALDALLLSVASLFVLRGLGAANSNSDIWLAFLVFTVSGGFVLAPIGSLLYTALAMGSFILGTYLYFPADSQYYDQLPIRAGFFIVFGLMSLGIAQELEKRRARLLQQNRELFESKQLLEEKSALLERALETERERARHDSLTGALNHAAIVDELRRLLIEGRAGSVTVAMVDVDGLKAINDTFGHQLGDAVLTTVAGALAPEGAVVGRYGGDEFVVVLPGVNRPAAERYRADVLQALSDTVLTDPESGTQVSMVVSIGLATYPEEADTIEDLIKLSDSGMYAFRREHVLGPVATSAERAASIVGEMVPLLTAPGDLRQKLQLVAERLSAAAGYDSVDILLGEAHGPPTMQSTYADDEELVRAWIATQRDPKEPRTIASILRQTGRPLLMDGVQNDRRLTDSEREVLKAAGIKSAVITPMMWQGEMIGTLAVGRKREAAFGPLDAQFLVAVAAQVTAIVRMATLVEELQSTSASLREAQTETVLLLAAAAEAHDRTTGLHLRGIRAITEALARELGYDEEDAAALALAAVLHDIGKIRVPDSILADPSRLSEEAWDLMTHHTVWGAEFLAGRPGFELAATIARSHHERWDGSGYPDGLQGEAIPEAAAIVAVADTLDAMINERPYREAQPLDEAVAEIAACAGQQFSPKVVDVLRRLHERGVVHHLASLIVEREAA